MNLLCRLGLHTWRYSDRIDVQSNITWVDDFGDPTGHSSPREQPFSKRCCIYCDCMQVIEKWWFNWRLKLKLKWKRIK